VLERRSAYSFVTYHGEMAENPSSLLHQNGKRKSVEFGSTLGHADVHPCLHTSDACSSEKDWAEYEEYESERSRNTKTGTFLA